MSRIQSKAEPLVSKLIQGSGFDLPVDDEHLSILTSWSAMSTMVMEFAHPSTATVPQSHRNLLRLSGSLSTEWSVFASAFHPPVGEDCAFNHWGVTHYYPNVGLIQSIQTTGFYIGHLFIQTVMITAEGPFSIDRSGFTRENGMTMIWPRRPERTLIDTSRSIGEFYDVSNAIAGALGVNALRLPIS